MSQNAKNNKTKKQIKKNHPFKHKGVFSYIYTSFSGSGEMLVHQMPFCWKFSSMLCSNVSCKCDTLYLASKGGVKSLEYLSEKFT